MYPFLAPHVHSKGLYAQWAVTIALSYLRALDGLSEALFSILAPPTYAHVGQCWIEGYFAPPLCTTYQRHNDYARLATCSHYDNERAWCHHNDHTGIRTPTAIEKFFVERWNISRLARDVRCDIVSR